MSLCSFWSNANYPVVTKSYLIKQVFWLIPLIAPSQLSPVAKSAINFNRTYSCEYSFGFSPGFPFNSNRHFDRKLNWCKVKSYFLYNFFFLHFFLITAFMNIKMYSFYHFLVANNDMPLPNHLFFNSSSPLMSAIPVGWFLCKGTAFGQLPRAANANVLRILQQPSANRRLGYSVKSARRSLVLFASIRLSVLHKNHSPTRSRKSFKKREIKSLTN